jgi:hypothetical protein
MKLNFWAKALLGLIILAAGSSGHGQVNMPELSVQKTKWRAIVTKRMPGVQGWNAGFPTERSVDPKDPKSYGTGGDSLMYAAYLCSVGELEACKVIPNSLEPSGQLRRNPLLKGQPSGSKRGSLSKDHTLATIYWLTLPNNIVSDDVKRNFLMNWQKSFTQPITTALECEAAICLTDTGRDPFENMVATSAYDLSPFVSGQGNLNLNIKLPPLSVETLKKGASSVQKGAQQTFDAYKAVIEKEINIVKACTDNSKACIDNYLAKVKGVLDTVSSLTLEGAQQLQSCLASDKDVAKCIKTNVKGTENYVKGMIAATSLCAEGLEQGVEAQAINQTELGRCVVNLLTTALAMPRFCEDMNCFMPPTQMVYLGRIYAKLGLPKSFSTELFDLLGVDSEETVLMSASYEDMNEANLVALNILVRRNLGMKTSRLTGRLMNRFPANPFFQTIHKAIKGSPHTNESIAGVVLDQCQSIESQWNGKPQYLVAKDELETTSDNTFSHDTYWRWKTNEQDDFDVDPVTKKVKKKISLVWDCIFMADALGAAEYPILGVPAGSAIVLKVKKNENPTVYDTLAKTVVGGVPPLKFELESQPTSSDYFSFDPDTGVFIYRPKDTYSPTEIVFHVSDRTGMRLKSKVTIAFDHSVIYPGHPPLTETPTRPLPASIYPLITITNPASNQVRSLNDTAESPSELLTVSTGVLDIQAEAYIENVDDSYTGNLDCTVDWTSKGNSPSLITDADEYPRNFFIQQSIDVASLEPYQFTVFRMSCMAPDMPIITRDIPVVYTPSAVPLAKALGKANYNYAGTNGATLALTFDKNISTDFNHVYNYVLKTMECGQSTGTLDVATNVNKVTINGSFDGLLASGDPQKMVWLNVPVCDRNLPIVWKLQSSSAGGSGPASNSCKLSAYSTKDGASLVKPSSFDVDMLQCGKAVRAADWSCSWVSADKTWILPSLRSVVFTADRWGAGKYNIFSFDTVRRSGCIAPETFLEPQANSCDLIKRGYKTKDSTGNRKPSSFMSDMTQCASKVNASDWGCSWVSADESWVIPGTKTVIFTANRWGADKYNVFGFDTVRRNGCRNPDSFVRP